MEFTKDWSHTRMHWPELFAPYAAAERVLEVGCYEGQSTVSLLELMPAAYLIVVDPFPFEGQLDRYHANIDEYRRRVRTEVGPSSSVLPNLQFGSAHFDVIYIDGSHRTEVVLADAVLAWPMLKPGGLLLFDDYDWPDHPPGEDVRMAVDAFTDCFGLEGETGWGDQYVIRRSLV